VLVQPKKGFQPHLRSHGFEFSELKYHTMDKKHYKIMSFDNSVKCKMTGNVGAKAGSSQHRREKKIFQKKIAVEVESPFVVGISRFSDLSAELYFI
jgi:hypothetical protein